MHSAIKPISVVVCDVCPMIFCGLKQTFTASSSIDFRLEVSNLQTLREAVRQRQYRIALLDAELVRIGDPEIAQLLKQVTQDVHVVLYGRVHSVQEHRDALEAGVKGILSKHHSPRYIRRAILKVADGGIWLEATAAETMLDHMFSSKKTVCAEGKRLNSITPREHKVIELVCRGLRNKQIAAKLSISETTVCHHLTSIFAKLGVSDRVALVTFAYRHELHLPVLQSRPAFRIGSQGAPSISKVAC